MPCHFKIYSPKAVNAWVHCVFHNAFIGGVCSGSTANGHNQCLDSLSKYSSTMMCPGFNVIFLIINGPVTLFCCLCFQQIDRVGNEGQSLEERLPFSTVTCWDNSTSRAPYSIFNFEVKNLDSRLTSTL